MHRLGVVGGESEAHRRQGGDGAGDADDGAGGRVEVDVAHLHIYELPGPGHGAVVDATLGVHLQHALGEAHGAHLQADAVVDARALAEHHLGGAAAEVDHQPGALGHLEVALGAEPGEAGLLLAADDLDAQAELALQAGEVGLRVHRPTGGRGGHGLDRPGLDAELLGDADVVLERLGGGGHALGLEQPPVAEPLAEPDHPSLVVEQPPVVGDHGEQHAVGPDVDGGGGHSVSWLPAA